MTTTHNKSELHSVTAAWLIKQADHKRRVGELARQSDELSDEMGVSEFRDAIRKHGYDVDADLGILARRGVDGQKH